MWQLCLHVRQHAGKSEFLRQFTEQRQRLLASGLAAGVYWLVRTVVLINVNSKIKLNIKI